MTDKKTKNLSGGGCSTKLEKNENAEGQLDLGITKTNDEVLEDSSASNNKPEPESGTVSEGSKIKSKDWSFQPSESENNRKLLTRNAAEISPRSVRWLWKNVIPLAACTIVAGHGGHGKSQLAISIAATISRGDDFPDGSPCEQGQVVIISAEDTAEEVIVPRLMAAKADLQMVQIFDAIQEKQSDGSVVMRPSLNLGSDIEALGDLIAGLGDVRLVIIDPLMAFMNGVDTYKNSDARGIMAPLAKLAEKHNFAILFIQHLNKSTSQSSYARFTGSTGFLDAARAGFVVGHSPDNDGSRVLASVKSNWARDDTSFSYEILSEDVVGECQDIPFIEWLGKSQFTAAEVIAFEVTSDKTSAIEVACNFLEDLLANAPTDANKVYGLAREQGISKSTLDRAKAQLNISSERQGGKDGKWVWKLP